MRVKNAALIGLAALLCAFSPTQDTFPHTDSYAADRTDVEYVFHCGQTRAYLKIRESIQRDRAVALADRQRISLQSFSVSGRNVSAPDLHRLQTLFQRFVWIDSIRGRCTRYNGDVYIDVVGMDAVAWASFAGESREERPRAIPILIAISESGAIRIS